MKENPVLEAMYTQRAIRRFTTDPVSDDDVTTILKAAVRAPSGGNSQPWHFLVIRNRDVKRRIGEYHGRAALEARNESAKPRVGSPSSDYLIYNMEDVPVLIIVCINANPAPPPPDTPSGSSTYPAVQNLMLAARTLGLGSCITTRFRRFETEVKELLGIPKEVDTAALIPIGYPGEGEHFGGSRRKPVREVTFHDYWGRKAF